MVCAMRMYRKGFVYAIRESCVQASIQYELWRFFNLVNKEEKEAIRSFVSKYSQLNILFPLSDNHLYGGYHLGYINTNLNGFRSGKVSPTKVLDLKYRNKKCQELQHMLTIKRELKKELLA